MTAIIGPVSALRACGRFIVTISTWPRRSTRAWGGSLPLAGAGAGAGVELIAVISPHFGPGWRVVQNSNTF
jgi:hypothetical protein